MGHLRHDTTQWRATVDSPDSFDITQKVAGLCAGSSFIQKGEEKKCAN